MKKMKNGLIALLFLLPFIGFSQIKTREITVTEVNKPIIYDSTYYFGAKSLEKEELKKFIGQKIFTLPFSKTSRRQEYFSFSKNYNMLPEYDEDAFIPDSSFANQYLTILDAEAQLGYNNFRLKLLYNTDTIYYITQFEFDRGNLPFILPAFFEKSKSYYLNKKFISKQAFLTTDINSGERISISKNEEFECVDISIIDIKKKYQAFVPSSFFYIPLLVFRNNKNNEIIVNFFKGRSLLAKNNINDYYPYNIKPKIFDFHSEKEYELSLISKLEQENLKQEKIKLKEAKQQDIINKYGNYFGKLINNNKVSVGMTKEMCKISWGYPFSINETITENTKIEIWQYNYKTFLYFENNKLKIINQ